MTFPNAALGAAAAPLPTATERWPGRAALMVAHCAGMVDLVALPVWVGTLIAHYKFDPQQAGGLATLFLIGAVASSLFFAPRFNRLRSKVATTCGFGLAALAFAAMSTTGDFATMAILHVLAGISVGCALSVTHGTIGRSRNPHRLFALAGVAVGFFAVAILGGTPQLIAAYGGPVLFVVFAGVMAVAAVTSALMFPVADTGRPLAQGAPVQRSRIDPAVWFAVLGVACLGLVQAMMFSFIERIGSDRGFGFQAVSGVLIALGLVNLFPAPFAALMQRRWPAHRVVLLGPIVQAALAATIAMSSSFMPYALATAVFAAVMIFVHTFAFGLLAGLDPSGRAVAATPAMLMIGAAIGPVLGGTLVKAAGYGSLGYAAIFVAVLAVASFWRVRPVAAATRVLA